MKLGNITIVPSTLATAAGFRDAVEQVALERRHLLVTTGFSLEQAEDFVRSLLAGGGTQFVALDGDTVIGWCDVKRMKREGTEHCGILGLGVLAPARGLGIGSALLRKTMGAAWELGLTRIELEVFASNAPAIHLYEKAGFVIEGRKVQARILDNVTDDIICMAVLR